MYEGFVMLHYAATRSPRNTSLSLQAEPQAPTLHHHSQTTYVRVLLMAIMALNWLSMSGQGCLAVNISSTVQPSDQMSALRPAVMMDGEVMVRGVRELEGGCKSVSHERHKTALPAATWTHKLADTCTIVTPQQTTHHSPCR